MVWTAPRDWSDGEFVTEAIMDVHVRDNLLALMHPIVIKPSDEGPISSTTFQSDDHLIVPVGTNEVWLFQYFLKFVAAVTTADPKVRWTFPTGGTANMCYIGYNQDNVVTDFGQSTDTSPMDPGSALAARTSNAYGFMHGPITVMYVNGSTAGNVGLDWAPNAVNNLTMKARSSVWGAKLS